MARPSPMSYRFKSWKPRRKTPWQAAATALCPYVTVHRGDLSRFFRRQGDPDSRRDVLTNLRDNIPKLATKLVFRLDRHCLYQYMAGAGEGRNETVAKA